MLWGALGVLFLVGGFLLASPTFEHAPSAPRPWGLWIGTNGTYAPSRAVGRLLELRFEARGGCGGPVTATGKLRWDPSEHPWATRHSIADLIPSRLVLGVAGVTVLRAEVRDFRAARWRKVQIEPYHEMSIVDSRIQGSSGYGEPDVRFRVLLDALQPAGFEACSAASPAVLEYQGDDLAFEKATDAIAYLEHRHSYGLGRVKEFPVSDGVVWMSVEGHQPDRGLLDASSRIQGNRILVTCTSTAATHPRIWRNDPFAPYREAIEESSCGSVQTFKVAGAAEDLNERIFFAGILISAGVALLLEALITGQSGAVGSAASFDVR